VANVDLARRIVMEDDGKVNQRRMMRCYECNRLEDEVWALAYEQVWPVVRKSLKDQSQRFVDGAEVSPTRVSIAKGA
jgi:hypothetical protein